MVVSRSGRLAIAVMALFAPLLALAAAPSEAAAQLQRMARAMRQDNYQGVLVYQHDGRIDSLKIFHGAGEQERERLLSLSGDLREVVRHGSQLICRQGKGEPLQMSVGAERSLIPLVPHLRPGELGLGYRLATLGEERVAGYVTQVLEVQPCDEFRYGYRLWLERDSGILLRAALLGPDKVPLEQMMFVNVEIGSPPREQDLGVADADAVAAKQDAAEIPITGPARWEFSQLPPSFRLESRLGVSQGSASEHLLLTDGVANVSVYVEPRTPNGVTGVSLGTRGALSMFSREFGTQRVVVLGNVPARTAGLIAQALQPVADPAGK